MTEFFKPQSLTIKGLLQDPTYFYAIPRYQRPYKWGDEQVEQLWSDLSDAFDKDEPYYFLGSIITAPSTMVGKYLDVVDGQQRLTTLMILCSVFRDLFPDINAERAETDPSVIDADALKDSIQSKGKFPRLKLVTHPNHQSDFEELIVKGNTLTIQRPTKKQLSNEDQPRYRFQNTAALFSALMSELDEQKAGRFLDYIFNQVHIIRIDCTSKEFAIRLFQVLNDRGLDLTAADLIKSFLLERIGALYATEPDIRQQKEDQFIYDWQETELQLRDTDMSLNDLFVLYQYYILASNPRRSLSDELQDQFKDKDPNEVIASIKKFANCYPKLLKMQQRDVYALRYTRWTVYWKSILLTTLMSDYPDFNGLAGALRRFYYMYWVGGRTLTLVKQLSFNIIGWIKSKQPVSFIEGQINEKFAKDGILPDVLRGLQQQDIYHEDWSKPLLLTFEYAATENGKLHFISLSKELHVEHILPQKYKVTAGWEHITDVTAARWLNSGGNLTLLSGRKNIQASNNAFEDKVKVYTGKGLHKPDDQKITPFLITQQIANEYHAGLFNQQWDEVALRNRWDWFRAQVKNVLSVDIPAELP